MKLTRSRVRVCVCVNKTFNLSLSLSGVFGFMFGLAGMIVYDGQRVRESGMFQGYNTITYTVVVLQVWNVVFFIFSLYHLNLCVMYSLCVQSASQTVFCACRLWAGWSSQWSLNMQTTSSKDSPPLCPSSRLQSFHISCWRTLIPLGKHIHTHAHSSHLLISSAENKRVHSWCPGDVSH